MAASYVSSTSPFPQVIPTTVGGECRQDSVPCGATRSYGRPKTRHLGLSRLEMRLKQLQETSVADFSWGTFGKSVHQHIPASPCSSPFIRDTPKEHIGWEIECQSEWGALLILRDYAKQESLLSDKQCMRYIYANHMSWYHFAMASHLPFEFEPEDVVLVKGTVKTSDWAVLALQVEHNMSDEAPLFRGTFEPEETGGFVLSVKESSRMCYEYHCSPTGPQRQDHCLFVSHYRIKYRDGPPGLGSSHSIEVDVTYPVCVSPSNPVLFPLTLCRIAMNMYSWIF